MTLARRSGWAALGLALASAAALRADPAPAGERDAFYSALGQVGHDDARAGQELEALAARGPDGEFAADALIQAAEIDEQRLGKPAEALALYQRLIARYPSSRLALRARARADFLAANLRTGAPALAAYQDVLNQYAARGPAESVLRMERLLVEHPDFALASEARIWLARGALTAGRFDEAERRYADVEARAPGTAAALEARKGRADAALSGGHPLRARAIYESLLGEPRAFADAGRVGIAACDQAIARAAAMWAALAYLLGFLAASAVAGRRTLARLPFELKFYLPIALLFVAAAATEHRAVAVATFAIAAGGALVVWLGGAATASRLARGPLSRGRRLARASATALAVLALGYCAIESTHLTDFVVETVRHGPDR